MALALCDTLHRPAAHRSPPSSGIVDGFSAGERGVRRGTLHAGSRSKHAIARAIARLRRVSHGDDQRCNGARRTRTSTSRPPPSRALSRSRAWQPGLHSRARLRQLTVASAQPGRSKFGIAAARAGGVIAATSSSRFQSTLSAPAAAAWGMTPDGPREAAGAREWWTGRSGRAEWRPVLAKRPWGRAGADQRS